MCIHMAVRRLMISMYNHFACLFAMKWHTRETSFEHVALEENSFAHEVVAMCPLLQRQQAERMRFQPTLIYLKTDAKSRPAARVCLCAWIPLTSREVQCEVGDHEPGLMSENSIGAIVCACGTDHSICRVLHGSVLE